MLLKIVRAGPQGLQRSRVLLFSRKYHDDSFGSRKAREFVLPDCEYPQSYALRPLSALILHSDTPAQLLNRTRNAPLLRYVDSIRMHGHRAAQIDPLDLLQRDEVAALDPTRYGLVDTSQKYNVNGIIWTGPFGSHGQGDHEEWMTLGEVTSHLRSIYVERIAYEYMHSLSKTERLWFSHLLESRSKPVAERNRQKKKRIFELLARSETFDAFLQLKFPNLKRYGLEGGESMIPALDSLFSVSSRGQDFPTDSCSNIH